MINSPPIQTTVDDRQGRAPRLAEPWVQWFTRLFAFLGVESQALQWVPTFTGLTVVNGTGGATYTGTYTKIGRMVFWTVTIAVTGTCTTASVLNATYINNLPFTVGVSGTCEVVNAAGLSSGVGQAPASGVAAYPPAWAAYNGGVTISGCYST